MNAIHVTQPAQVKPMKLRLKSNRDLITATLFLIPSTLLLTIFVFYPMLKTVYLSLFITDIAGHPVTFVGFQNYLDLFQSAGFLQSVGVTAIFVSATTIGTIVCALGLALLTFTQLKGIGFFKTIFASTMGISVSVASVFWLFLFNPTIGIFDRFFKVFAMKPINFLADPTWALPSIIMSSIWIKLGFAFLVLLAGLQSIPTYLYESADIDGSSYGYKLRRITIPMLSPTLFFVLVVTLIETFQTFGQVDMLTKGGPAGNTNLIVYGIYRSAFLNHDYGDACAESVFLAIVISLVTYLQFKFTEKAVHYQ